MKPYAILLLHNLRIVRFDTKDEMLDAMKTLAQQDRECLAFHLHNGTGVYVQMETEIFR